MARKASSWQEAYAYLVVWANAPPGSHRQCPYRQRALQGTFCSEDGVRHADGCVIAASLVGLIVAGQS